MDLKGLIIGLLEVIPDQAVILYKKSIGSISLEKSLGGTADFLFEQNILSPI
jgi:hypothetical protein